MMCFCESVSHIIIHREGFKRLLIFSKTKTKNNKYHNNNNNNTNNNNNNNNNNENEVKF